MLVTAKAMLGDAQKRGYAVCAPNFFNYETARVAIETAEELNAPILLDFGYRGQIPLESLIKMMRPIEILALASKVPVVLQQDHGRTFEFGVQCIRAGFTSIMADRSQLPFEENTAQVKELARIAHACGVSIEAELGHVGQGQNYEVDGVSNLTNPQEAVRYVEETGIDSLAIAIGTAHGKYSGTPHIDFELLEKIRKVVDIPLVLHGGSSSGDENLSKAAKSGICKINIATDLVTEATEKALAGDNAKLFDNFLEGYKSKLVHYIKLFGHEGKAEGWGL
ncbi:MAG: class II fructose-bisphosphate aldolase [Treponema sp.]|jgi:fructose-bisphosphate aldolase class II|nr:class II fructose-bisphosphate aldolase [Treponema sp.]